MRIYTEYGEGRIRENTGEYGGIRENTGEYGEEGIRGNTGRGGENTGEYGGIRENMGRGEYGGIQENTGEYGEGGILENMSDITMVFPSLCIFPFALCMVSVWPRRSLQFYSLDSCEFPR